jgi:hypothetical protein
MNRTPTLTDRDSIVIGQFENTTSDPVFDETLLTALKVHLGQSPFLDIIPDQRIRETLESMNRRAGDRLEHEVAREVCQRLSVKAMLEGSVAALGSHYVVTLTATDCQTGEPLTRTQAEATSKERVLTELGTISSSMRTKLGESLPSIRRFDVPIEQATTPSLAALKAYTLGQEERRRGRELESVAFFNQAIENDREFAAAYITLSTVYGSLGEWRRSEEFAKRANAVTRPLSERERLLIAYQYHDRVTGNQALAAEALELWKAAYPRDFRPAKALEVIYNRGAGSAASQSGASVSAVEPRLRVPSTRTRCRRAQDRGGGRQARGRDHADPPSPLSVGPRRRRRLRGRPFGLGEEQTTRVRSGVRGGAGCRLRGSTSRRWRPLSTRDRHRASPRAERNGIRLRGAPRLDRGPLP